METTTLLLLGLLMIAIAAIIVFAVFTMKDLSVVNELNQVLEQMKNTQSLKDKVEGYREFAKTLQEEADKIKNKKQKINID